jgi:vacuolar protein sorting-associated protein 3
MSRRPAFQKSGILVFGENSIQSLVPSTLISQVEALLDSHRIQDAIKLADQQHTKLGGLAHPDPEEVRLQ